MPLAAQLKKLCSSAALLDTVTPERSIRQMVGKNYIKIASIIGFVLGIILTPYIVLAPNDHPIKTSRMAFPESSIPKTDVAPGTPVPLSAKITRVVVATLFVAPFGALVGGGVGLLLTGLLQPKRKDEEATEGGGNKD